MVSFFLNIVDIIDVFNFTGKVPLDIHKLNIWLSGDSIKSFVIFNIFIFKFSDSVDVFDLLLLIIWFNSSIVVGLRYIDFFRLYDIGI